MGLGFINDEQFAELVNEAAMTDAAVASFNGRTGVVSLSGVDVTSALTYTPTSVTTLTGVQSIAAFKIGLALNNVDNTADAAKNVLTATKLTTSRSISMTGDATWAVSFDGSGNATAAGTLVTVNTNVGSFGSATQVATFTVNAKGLITAAGNTTITPAVGSITGLGTGVGAALGINIGSAGAFVTFNGALGTPSSGALTNCTFPTLNQNTTGSAATLTTSRNFSISGGITAAAVGFNGSAAVVLSASVDASHITLARMADVATATVFYRKTAGTGAPEVQTLATLKTDLGLTGTNSGDQTITLTGDVTGSGTGSFTATIGSNKVTFAKFVAATAASIVGATAAGNFAELTPSSARTVMGLGTMATQAASAVAITGGTATFVVAAGTFAQGQLYYDATHGVVHAGKTGSTNSNVFTSAGGTIILANPAGTSELHLGNGPAVKLAAGALTNALNDAAAALAGVAVGYMYRNGSVLMIRVV